MINVFEKNQRLDSRNYPSIYEYSELKIIALLRGLILSC